KTLAPSPTTMLTRTITAPIAPSGRRRAKSLVAAHQRDVRVATSGISANVSAGLIAMGYPLPECDARIDPRVGQVDHEVHEDEDEGHQQHQRLGERVVAMGNRFDEQEPEPIEVEDLLGDDEPAHEEGELE